MEQNEQRLRKLDAEVIALREMVKALIQSHPQKETVYRRAAQRLEALQPLGTNETGTSMGALREWKASEWTKED